MKIDDRTQQPKKPHTFIKTHLFANGKHKPLRKLLEKKARLYSDLVKRYGEEQLLNMATQLNIHQVPTDTDYIWTLAEDKAHERFKFKRMSDM